MSSSLYDGLDDAIEQDKSGGSRSSWVLGRTSNASSVPAKSGLSSGATGIARLVASAAAPSSNLSLSGNSSSMMLMQSHMAAKRAHGRRGPNEISRSTVAPVVDLQRRHGGGNSGEGSYRFNQMTGKMERVTNLSSRSSNHTSSNVVTGTGLLYGEPNLPLGVVDEYNPLFPNDYEELAQQRREKRKADERAMTAARATEANSNGGGGGGGGGGSGMCRRPVLSDSGSDSDDGAESTSRRGGKRVARGPPPASRHHSRHHNQGDGDGGGRGRGVGSGVAIAPPSSLLQDVVVAPDISHPPPDLLSSTTPDASNAQVAQEHGGKFGINPIAAKMMANMGYCVGKGLGKDGQGMASALMVEKTSRRGGKIIHERDRQKTHQTSITMDLQEQENPVTETTTPANATSVVLLRNMCGPGEVDDDLEPETAEECAKYGPVVTCMIFELPDAPEDEAVRIFVEFVSEESAVKAICDLNGRFFGGRVVKAGFYNAERFRNLELNDPPLS